MQEFIPASALELKKEVRNVTQNGTFGTTNKAKSADTLEYRITYTNNGTTPITGLKLADATPNYTVHWPGPHHHADVLSEADTSESRAVSNG